MTRWRSVNLACWGNHPMQPARVARPERRAEAEACLDAPGPGGVIARGLGRSYGDAALNDGGAVVLTERLNRAASFDPQTGVLETECGITMGELAEAFLPRGWFPPVVPGTRFVTLGGAIAADIHGKNHHVDGSVSNFIQSFTLRLPGGERVVCSRESNAELFDATHGGMGLTGFIETAQLRLRPVESAWMRTARERTPNLAETVAALERQAGRATYSVAWLDCLRAGSAMGRGVVFSGEHARAEEVRAIRGGRSAGPFDQPRERARSVPVDFPGWALNPLSVRAFNTAYWWRHGSGEGLEPCAQFFWPLDAVRGWNRIYGRRGFQQYQVVIPFEAGLDAVRELLDRLIASRRASFLAVLKTMGAPGPGPLSFPMPGWTLALDMAHKPGLDALLGEVDERVAAWGGRRYLAKDAGMTRTAFDAMYPGAGAFRELRRRIDPEGRMQSSLSRRLGL